MMVGSGARRGDEVLESLEALAEVALDRAGNHVTARVGHEAAHAGDLTHLRHVPACARTDHHVDGVEACRLELVLHCLLDVRGGVGPDAHFLLTALAVGDDASTELVLDLVGLLFELVENGPLGGGGLHVFDGDGESRLSRVAVTDVLDVVERLRDDGLRVVVRETLDDQTHFLLLQRLVDVAEALGVVGGQRLFEEQTAGRGVDRATVTRGEGFAELDRRVQRDRLLVERAEHFPTVLERATRTRRLGDEFGEVEATDDHVLRRVVRS